jgi:predicted phosphatase
MEKILKGCGEPKKGDMMMSILRKKKIKRRKGVNPCRRLYFEKFIRGRGDKFM